MSQEKPSNPTPITLDELIALNDEIAALVHGGVPLGFGLSRLGADMPGRLGEIAGTLAERVDRGQSLPEALAEESPRFPAVYRAVVEAGQKAGRLPIALEGLAASAGRIAETRRLLASAMLYPLIVLLLAWGLLVLFTSNVAPRLVPPFEAFEAPGLGLLDWLARCGRHIEYWGPIFPLVVILLVGWWWFRSRRAGLVESGLSKRLLGWVPWTGNMLRWLGTATFADVLALLVENGVPLDEAVVLAARSTGDSALLRDAEKIAAALKRGESLGNAGLAGTAIPPLVRWLMVTGQAHNTLLPALRHAAATYRRRAQRQAEIARAVLPVGLTLVLGGTVTLLYGLMVFGPWVLLLRKLGGI